jgi:hypothetical protein
MDRSGRHTNLESAGDLVRDSLLPVPVHISADKVQLNTDSDHEKPDELS